MSSLYGGNEAFVESSSQLQKAANPSDFFGEKAATKPQLSPAYQPDVDFWDGFQPQTRSHEFETPSPAAPAGAPANAPATAPTGTTTSAQAAPAPAPTTGARILKFPVQPFSIDGTPIPVPTRLEVVQNRSDEPEPVEPAPVPNPAQPEVQQPEPAPASASTAHRQRLPKLAGVSQNEGFHPRSFTHGANSSFETPSWTKPVFMVLGAVFVLWLVCTSMGALFFGPPNLTGKWYVGAENEGNVTEGEFVLVQKDAKLTGAGSDSVGNFKLAGHLDGGHVELTKKYVAPEGQLSKPINFAGEVHKTDDALRLRGKWHCERRIGYSWHGHVVKFQGEWTADLEERLAADDIPTFERPIQENDSKDQPTGDNTLGSLANMFVWGAVIFLAIGIGLFVASFALFGRGGIININEKRKYVPSQFKNEHKRIMQQLGQPLEPGGLPLGTRYEWRSWKYWQVKDLALSCDLRRRDAHMLVLGVSGKGKSRFLSSMLTHDIISNDRSIVLVDSDGGLADYVMKWVASQPNGDFHAQRVVVIDPTAREMTQTFNPLALPVDGDLQSASSSIVFGFKAMYKERGQQAQGQSQWNAQTAHILRNAALLLMVNNKTLADLPALLGDNDFRDFLLQAVAARKDERPEYLTLLETWNQYKKLARTEQWIPWVEPILNRATPMLGDPRIRHILTSNANEVNLKALIREKKILIVRLPQGQLETHADLVGSLVITGLKQAALSIANERTGAPPPPVALYLDEFDRFIEIETIKSLTAESDRLGIGMIGAAKTLQDLPEDFRNQLLVSVGTISCFALAKKDADLMGPQMFRVDGRKIKHQTMQTFFNRVNSSPQFEFVSDEEKLNVDRLIGRDVGSFFCYRVGSVAGVFHMRSHDVRDIQQHEINQALMQSMFSNRCLGEAPKPVVAEQEVSIHPVFSM